MSSLWNLMNRGETCGVYEKLKIKMNFLFAFV